MTDHKRRCSVPLPYSTVTCVPLDSSRATWAIFSSSRLRSPLRNSTRELRKWSRVAALTRFSSMGIAVSQKKQPPACAWAPAAAFFSSILCLLHFDGQYLILQLGAPGRKEIGRARRSEERRVGKEGGSS